MSNLGAGKDNLTTHTTVRRKAYIALRADAMGWTVSKYAAAIFDLWFRNGCLPVHEKDGQLSLGRWDELVSWETLLPKKENPEVPKAKGRATAQPFHKRR